MEFMARGHVYDDVPNPCQLEILNQEICLLQSAAVWHVLAICQCSENGQEQEPHIHEGVSVFSIVCNRHWLNGVQGPVTNLGIACLTHPPALSYSGCVLTLTLVRAEK